MLKTHCLTVLLLLSLLASITRVQAQKEVLYYQYQLNPMAINPAYTGNRESFHLTALFRRKMFNFGGGQGQGVGGGVRGGGSPVTQSLALDGALADGKLGIGLQALNDRMGLNTPTSVFVSAAYWTELPNEASVSIGATGGVSFVQLFDGVGTVNKTMPSAGVGIYYQSDTFFGGVSMPELYNKGYALAGRFLYTPPKPLFVQLGTKLQPLDDLMIYPSVLVTQVKGRKLGTDFNAKAWYMEKIGVGLSYRRNSLGFEPLNYLQVSAEYQLSDPVRVGLTYNTQTPEAMVNTVGRSVIELLFRYTPNLEGFTF